MLMSTGEEELALVVRMQARIRGSVVRKSVASRGNEKQRTFYYKALQNLHDLEVQYVAGLGVLVEVCSCRGRGIGCCGSALSAVAIPDTVVVMLFL